MNVLTTSELELLELKLILERKRNDIVCTESELASLKSFLKEYICIDTIEAMNICRDIQELFPIEYSEVIDEYDNQLPNTISFNKSDMTYINDLDLQVIQKALSQYHDELLINNTEDDVLINILLDSTDRMINLFKEDLLVIPYCPIELI